MNESQIESILRGAPAPSAPPGLHDTLLAGIALAQPDSRASSSGTSAVQGVPFWRRWLPAFSFGLIFLGCLVVLGVQTVQVRDLRTENEKLQEAVTKIFPTRFGSAPDPNPAQARISAEEEQELVTLRAEVEKLRELLKELPAVRAENQRLLAQRATAGGGVAPDNDPLAAARDTAAARQCLNNLKQIGLAARMWSNDHNTNALPLEWTLMKEALVTPKILTCPGDTARTPVLTWAGFDGSSVTYELPSTTPDEREPSTVYSRCPIHGSVGLTDGSAILKIKPEALIRVDGNLKLRSNAKIGGKP